MKKKKLDKFKLLMILGGIFLIGLVILVFSIISDKRSEKNNIEIIESNYQEIVNEVSNYNDVRSEYVELLRGFYLSTYQDDHDKYIDILNRYNDVMKKIDRTVLNLEEPCQKLYKDGDINKICQSYGKTYEKLVNLYVSDLEKYNDNINKYNDYYDKDIELYEMVHKEYIDYNNDLVYEGKDIHEED